MIDGTIPQRPGINVISSKFMCPCMCVLITNKATNLYAKSSVKVYIAKVYCSQITHSIKLYLI